MLFPLLLNDWNEYNDMIREVVKYLAFITMRQRRRGTDQLL